MRMCEEDPARKIDIYNNNKWARGNKAIFKPEKENVADLA